MELYEGQKWAEDLEGYWSDLSFCPPTDLEQRLPGAPGVFLAPHQGGLELVELLRPELLPAEDEADDMLRQLSEGAQAQHGVPVAVNEHQHLQENRRIYIHHPGQHLLYEELGALVLYVLVSRGEEGADGVHSDAGLYEAQTHLLQLLQAVVVRSVQDSFR